MECPNCKSKHIVKLGKIPSFKAGRKQRYKCWECGKTFYETGKSK